MMQPVRRGGPYNNHNAGHQRTFEYYLENYFKFPLEIKNDLIYCQRALQAHLRVHLKMVQEVFQRQQDADPDRKTIIIAELERDIFEINAEQQYLFVRLKRIINEFSKMLTKNNIPMNMVALNLAIANQVIKHIDDESLDICPITVSQRPSQEELTIRYFNIQRPDINSYEVLDSDEEAAAREAAANEDGSTSQQLTPTSDFIGFDEDMLTEQQQQQQEQQQEHPNQKPSIRVRDFGREKCLDPEYFGVAKTVEVASPNGSGNVVQVSLLKPIFQRMSEKTNTESEFNSSSDDVIIIEENSSCSDNFDTKPTTSDNITCEQLYEPWESQKVKMSRMNLRQALKKAHTETLAAKAAAKILRGPPALTAISALSPSEDADSTTIPLTAPPPLIPIEQTKTYNRSFLEPLLYDTKKDMKFADPKKENKETKVKIRIENKIDAKPDFKFESKAKTTKSTTTTSLNYSSEESNPDNESTVASKIRNLTEADLRTRAEQFYQDDFLRFFDLYTPAAFAHMQQRRSKRKRRCVQNNERGDFHYGRVEYGSYPAPEESKKKRNAFLLSPQLKRGIQPKKIAVKPPINVPELKTVDEIIISDSNSGSPENKRSCNECLSASGTMDRCEECKGYFHQFCCVDDSDEGKQIKGKKNIAHKKSKLCPTCKRVQQEQFNREEKQPIKILQETAQSLPIRVEKGASLYETLNKANDLYRERMRTMIDIVNELNIK